MSDEGLKPNQAIETVRAWVARLNPGAATLVEEVLPDEHVLRLLPSNPRATAIEFRFSNYGTVGLYFGRAFAVEDMPATADQALEICDSIRNGNLRETVWQIGGWTVRAKGELPLRSGSLWDDSRSCLLPIRFGRKTTIQYEPW